MFSALRRVALGITVVAAASVILLLSDLQHRERAARKALTKKHSWKRACELHHSLRLPHSDIPLSESERDHRHAQLCRLHLVR